MFSNGNNEFRKVVFCATIIMKLLKHWMIVVQFYVRKKTIILDVHCERKSKIF